MIIAIDPLKPRIYQMSRRFIIYHRKKINADLDNSPGGWDEDSAEITDCHGEQDTVGG